MTDFFLSYDTMVDLLIFDTGFPTIRSKLPHQHSEVVVSLNDNVPSKLQSHDDVTCDYRQGVKCIIDQTSFHLRLQMQT